MVVASLVSNLAWTSLKLPVPSMKFVAIYRSSGNIKLHV